ncbi:MAG TPA: ABC transporter permease subunit [Candidatus Scatovivens faecipullorum]|nr:ABC transporter permease subunit [Candidatus Scatovivens faecipullorum]
MWSVIKKELKSYVLSPIGYIFIGLFLIMFSIFFYLTIYQSQIVNFEYLFYNGATILTFITPILTMRMFAEERKNGTEQLLLTSPRSITSIVLGKFIAAAIIMFITELCTFMYFGILKYFGNPSLVVAINTLVGFFLLSLAYISFGMFASSLTENQIVASVITIGVFIGMWFLPGINEIFGLFSLMDKFEKYSYGLISIQDIITFVSFTLMFILLTIITLQRRKSIK